MFFILAVLLLMRSCPNEASAVITFPTSLTSLKPEKIDPPNVKSYQKGIDAVQSVAGLVQNLLLEETITFSGKNWIVSPVSLAAVFAQLLMGSRGDIRETLTNALAVADDGSDFTKLEVHRQLGDLLHYFQSHQSKDYIFVLKNVVFLQKGFPLKPTYKHALGDFYRTPIVPLDFARKSEESQKKMNEWLKNSTNGRFLELLHSPPSPTTVSIMASVVYFKGSWEFPFDPDYTQPGLFFVNENEKVQVDYMYGEEEILFGNATDYQLIGLPFKSRNVVIYILLPNGRFSTRLAIEKFDEIASTARYENVTIVLPKVKITSRINVRHAMDKYLKKKPENSRMHGARKLNKNFTKINELDSYRKAPLPLRVPWRSPRANSFDLSGASDDSRFKMDDIYHKVSFQMDEYGTELVGVTSALIDHTNSDFIVKVNRPFLFFIRHEPTSTHLFWGLVANPLKSSKPYKMHNYF